MCDSKHVKVWRNGQAHYLLTQHRVSLRVLSQECQQATTQRRNTWFPAGQSPPTSKWRMNTPMILAPKQSHANSRKERFTSHHTSCSIPSNIHADTHTHTNLSCWLLSCTSPCWKQGTRSTGRLLVSHSASAIQRDRLALSHWTPAPRTCLCKINHHTLGQSCRQRGTPTMCCHTLGHSCHYCGTPTMCCHTLGHSCQ